METIEKSTNAVRGHLPSQFSSVRNFFTDRLETRIIPSERWFNRMELIRETDMILFVTTVRSNRSITLPYDVFLNSFLRSILDYCFSRPRRSLPSGCNAIPSDLDRYCYWETSWNYFSIYDPLSRWAITLASQTERGEQIPRRSRIYLKSKMYFG